MVIQFHQDRVHGNDAIALNYREICPAGVDANYYDREEDRSASSVGGKSVAVPGCVAGLLYALEHYGTMPRNRVLTPAIRLAEEGFVVDAHYVSAAKSTIDWFNQNPPRQLRFAFVWQRFLRGGDVEMAM